MKKIKILTPILGLTALAGAMVPLASCSCKQDQTEKEIPADAFEIVDVTLKGFKEDFDYSKYEKLVIPSNVKVINTNAFKGLFNKNCKVNTVVIPGTLETIRKGAFEDCGNVSVYDFSQFNVDQIHELTVESGAFGNPGEDGSYSYIKMNDNWTQVQKDALKLKLMEAGVPSYWMTEQTSGNAELVGSMEQTSIGGDSTHTFNLKGQYDYTFKYYATLNRVDGTKDVGVEIKNVKINGDYKSITVESKMIGNNSHDLVDGDWVSYKMTLFCTYDDGTGNGEVVKWVENFATFKLTYQVAHPTRVTINDKAELQSLFTGEEKELTCTVEPESAKVKDVEWKSSDENIIKIVETTDKVTAKAVGAGKATIIVTCKDNGKQDSVEAEVTASGLAFEPISDTECKIIGIKGIVSETSITIPSKITVGSKEYKVVEIAENAFKGNTTLQSVTIPNSITKIGVDAFADCENLSEMNFENRMKFWTGTDGENTKLFQTFDPEKTAKMISGNIGFNWTYTDPQEFYMPGSYNGWDWEGTKMTMLSPGCFKLAITAPDPHVEFRFTYEGNWDHPMDFDTSFVKPGDAHLSFTPTYGSITNIDLDNLETGKKYIVYIDINNHQVWSEDTIETFTQPTKVVYTDGQTFDVTGASFTDPWDGTTITLTKAMCSIDGVQVTDSTTVSEGYHDVKVTYTNASTGAVGSYTFLILGTNALPDKSYTGGYDETASAYMVYTNTLVVNPGDVYRVQINLNGTNKITTNDYKICEQI